MTANAETAIALADEIVSDALQYLHEICSAGGKLSVSKLDDHQHVIYELSFAAAEVQGAQALLKFAATAGEFEQALADVACADCLAGVVERIGRNPGEFGVDEPTLPASVQEFMRDKRSTLNLVRLGSEIADRGGEPGARGLDDEKRLIADTFRQFGDEHVAPLAESIHRENLIIPKSILDGLRELGCFGLSVPNRYGGLLPDEHEDSIGMIVVTEELSRASLGGAGSLITRPEIMCRALMEGGTEEQKHYWLPRLAKGDPLCAISITEPNYGSDVASARLKATAQGDGYVLSGEKTWCTFAGKAGVLLTLARTDPDTSKGHRGLTLFMVEKPSFDGEDFKVTSPGGGTLTGRAISTVGYRGMHSFSLFFDDFYVPYSHVIGEGQGLGKGFYFTMRGFMGGRIQTAARACGVMQAAIEEATRYAKDRLVFGKPVADYQLTLTKLARMGVALALSRQFTYAVGRIMDAGGGQMEASLVKLYACRASEWITREAMQIHGGMGYAEESTVSRLWQDARVLSIFEGTEETLALKVVGRSLVESAA